jgi:hypothetical protein
MYGENPFDVAYIVRRRVNDRPGGKDSVGDLWDPNYKPEEFKPTRR